MSTLGKVIGSVSLVSGLLGAAALGGATAQRLALLRYRELGQGGDRPPDGDFDGLPSDRSYSVAAADGVALHTEEVGPPDAPLTVIFSHGWTLRLGSWHFQRIALAGPDFGAAAGHEPGRRSDVPATDGGATAGRVIDDGGADEIAIGGHATDGGSDESTAAPGPSSPANPLPPPPEARLVFYDQRSHGRSSRAAPGHSTIADLAADLAVVIGTAAPTGPLVLVGHSMGGMALLALAGRDPELFAARVRGVALLSTSASEPGGAEGRWLQINGANPLLPALAAAAARYPRAFERGRRSGRDLVWLMTRSLGFADPRVPAPLVDYLDRMISGTPIEVIAEFAPEVFGHDQGDAIPALSGIPALIMVGDRDRMTPPSRSEEIAQVLPEAELAVIPGAGHMAIMEAPDVVNRALRALLRRAWAASAGDTERSGAAERRGTRR